MCIIAVKPEGITLPDSIVEGMWNNNSDGAGFMYADRGRVKVVKGLMTLAKFKKALANHMHRKLVMHFRIRTHGDVMPSLTHPFWVVKNGVAMVHNGIIWDFAKKATNHESDSLLFARDIGRRFGNNTMAALADPQINEGIATEIGWSKLVFMDGSGETIFVNEKMGHWKDGVWYSNSGYTTWSWKGSSTKYGSILMDDVEDEGYGYYTGGYGSLYKQTAAAAEDEKELAIKRAQREAEYQALFAEFGEDTEAGEDVGQDFPSEDAADVFEHTGRPIGFLPSARLPFPEVAGLDHDDPDDYRNF